MALAPTRPEVSQTSAALPAGPAPRRWRAASDEFLVRAAARGHDGALSAIHDRYRAPLERYCRTLVLHHQDAEDAAQAALAAGLRAIVDDRARPQALRAWLYRIAHREALAVLRRRPPVAAGDDALIELLPVARKDRTETRADLAELLDELRALPERSRSALILHELAGLSFDEVAETLEISSAAARQAAYEARTKLRAGRSELALLFPAGPALALAGGAATATGGAGAAGILGSLFGGAGIAAKCAAVCATIGVVGAGSYTVTHPPVPRDERPAKVQRERPAAPADTSDAARTAGTPAEATPSPAADDRRQAARTRASDERRRDAASARRAARREAARTRAREAARARREAAAPALPAPPAPDVTAVDVEESPTGGEIPSGTQPSSATAPVTSSPSSSSPPSDAPVGSGAVTGSPTQDVVSVVVVE